jgi:hypothetical protein
MFQGSILKKHVCVSFRSRLNSVTVNRCSRDRDTMLLQLLVCRLVLQIITALWITLIVSHLSFSMYIK